MNLPWSAKILAADPHQIFHEGRSIGVVHLALEVPEGRHVVSVTADWWASRGGAVGHVLHCGTNGVLTIQQAEAESSRGKSK